jgi:ribosomal protein L11 methyltransferase
VAEEALDGGAVRLTSDGDLPASLPAGWAAERVEVDADAALDRWRDHARPVRVGPVVLQPPWVDPMPVGPGEVVVVLDAGRAFGSGSHPSTRLALAALAASAPGAERVLDVGCGSGVLAVAALLLGAREAVAVDVDDVAVATTSAVAAANGVGERIRVSTTPVGRVPGEFDLVVANVPAPVLVELADALVDRLRPGATLVVAGFLAEQASRVRAAFVGLVQIASAGEDSWASLTLVRPPT